MTPGQCANCGATLTGLFCATCGQRALESARSVGVLFHDAWHIVTHVDSRFWQTLRLLLLRPGRLTLEYFAEHRARYLPPVRLYLVLSVLFFALSSVGGRSGTGPDTAALSAERDTVTTVQDSVAKPDVQSAIREAESGRGFVVDTNECSRIKSSFKWLETRLRAACARHVADGGRTVRDAFFANIPKMMFVFLPVMALVMLLLYWRPRRYYVEHLVFFLHAHAAMFLILLLERPLSWTLTALPALNWAGGFIKFGAAVYAVWYVYRAMFVYYGQGRWRTLAKLTVVGFAYAIFLAITLGVTLVVSALTA